MLAYRFRVNGRRKRRFTNTIMMSYNIQLMLFKGRYRISIDHFSVFAWTSKNDFEYATCGRVYFQKKGLNLKLHVVS